MISLPASLEAILFASGEPLEKERLATLLGVSVAEVDAALVMLARELKGHGVALIETQEEVELRTAPEAASLVKKLRESELARDLGKASLETLAVIAYHNAPTSKVGAPTESVGGATRSEVDWVRGVNSSASMRTLLLRGLIDGREDPADKRRVRYTLTTEALAHLGLSRIDDLPRYSELARGTHTAVAGGTVHAE